MAENNDGFEKTQLGIVIKVDRVEARALPSLHKSHDDKVDFYVLTVEWNQHRYPDLVIGETERKTSAMYFYVFDYIIRLFYVYYCLVIMLYCD
jgi:hypothetical protein